VSGWLNESGSRVGSCTVTGTGVEVFEAAYRADPRIVSVNYSALGRNWHRSRRSYRSGAVPGGAASATAVPSPPLTAVPAKLEQLCLKQSLLSSFFFNAYFYFVVHGDAVAPGPSKGMEGRW